MSLFQLLQRRRARVLFICVGNSCRSQMAEAFARTYGSDVLEAHSAGLRPSAHVSRRTCLVMQEKGVSLATGSSTKFLSSFNMDEFDLIVNLCEYSLPDTSTMVLKRVLRDPSSGDMDAFRDVREDIEQFVWFLIVHCRVARQWHVNNEWSSELDGANPLYSEECAQGV